MAFENTNKANVAFKNLQNKSHTDSSKEIGAEADSIFFNIDSTTIFTDTIDPNPSVAEASGIAFQVTAELVYDTSSNDQAWKAVWPSPLPAGAPDGVSSGDRVTNAISAAYGVPYEAKPYDVNDDLISPDDPRAWIYQYQSGIFYQQDNVGPLPKEIIIYVYIGTYLNDALENAGSGDVSSINYASANMDMTCEVATIGDQVVSKQVIEFPISDVLVKLNGIQINVGEEKDCYFSPDGLFIRGGSSAQKGDYLYWNSDKYDLDAIDECDFVYMVDTESLEIANGDEIVIEDNQSTQNVRFTGGLSETAEVTLGNTTIIVGNVAGDFVWDIGGAQEHTFTEPNTYIEVIYSGDEHVIWYDGAGSLLFSVKSIRFVEDDSSLTSLATSNRGDLACNHGLTHTPYDVTSIKISVDGGSDINVGATEYTGLTCTLLDKISTNVSGDYAFGNDYLNTSISPDPEIPEVDLITGILTGKTGDYIYFIDAENNAGTTPRWGYYYTDTNECTWINLSDLDSGGSHEITGDSYPTTGSLFSIIEHPTLNIMYFAFTRAVWELNLDTLVGTTILDKTAVDVRVNSISIDKVDNYLYISTYGEPVRDAFVWDMDLRTVSTMSNTDNGDSIGQFFRSIEVSPDADYLAMCTANVVINPGILLVEKSTSTIGYRLTHTSTSTGGSYEVTGDPMPIDDVTEAVWALDINNDQILISVTGNNLWLFNIETNSGKLFNKATTGVNGRYEVEGDPMQVNGMGDIHVSDDFHKVYFTCTDGVWVYDFITNTGVTYNDTTLSERNSKLDTLLNFNLNPSWSISRVFSITTVGDDIYIGALTLTNAENSGIFVIRPNGYTLLDYAWFEDSNGKVKYKYNHKKGDKLRWNSHKCGYNLTGSEVLDFKYYI